MRQLFLMFAGLISMTLATGCCCWDRCNPCGGCSTGGCGPGGCGIQQYGQPYNTGAYFGPTPVQQAYVPYAPVTSVAVGPVESLPTYR